MRALQKSGERLLPSRRGLAQFGGDAGLDGGEVGFGMRENLMPSPGDRRPLLDCPRHQPLRPLADGRRGMAIP